MDPDRREGGEEVGGIEEEETVIRMKTSSIKEKKIKQLKQT